MRELLEQRARIISLVREYFVQAGFLEVESPLLVPTPSSEPYLEVFETELKAQSGVSARAFLTTSPEYAMKKMIGAGSGSIFQICKSFRNGEEVSEQHNSEFTILEWYHVAADYWQTMTDTEELIRFVAGGLGIVDKLKYGKTVIDLRPPWPRASVAELFEEHAGLTRHELLDRQALARAAAKHQLSQSTRTSSYAELFNLLFLNLIEPNLPMNNPIFVHDYPLPLAALAKESEKDEGYAERFELYIHGLELANAFSELVDADILLARQQADLEERKTLAKTRYSLDKALLESASRGWPEMSGVALGLDRLIMLFTNNSSIEQVLSFPQTNLFSLEK